MRLLPYSKQLIARRAAGERPWLVVVTLGNDAQRKLMRMAAFEGDPGVARIWVPDDFKIAEADLSWVVGLDVFVAPFCEGPRFAECVMALWRARPATLWVLDGTTERDAGGRWVVNPGKFTGTQVTLYPPARGAQDMLPTHRHQVPLGKSFKDEVTRARDSALLVGDEPLFNDSRFAEVRAGLLAA